jgi:cell division protein FtsB
MQVFSLRAFWLPVFLTTFVAAFFGAVLGRQGRVIENTLGWQVGLERELATARAATRRIVAERNALLSSPEAIERVAREDLGYAAPGEKITPCEPVVSAQAVRVVSGVKVSRLERLLLSPRLPLVLPAGVFVGSAVVFAAINIRQRKGRPDRYGDVAAAREPFEAGMPV